MPDDSGSSFTDYKNIFNTEVDPTLDSPLAFRVLRHHTKNALQRIIAQCEYTELRRTTAGIALADEVQRRIMLSARISDALFGLTAAPGNFEDRLEALVEATVGLLNNGNQLIHTEIKVEGNCHKSRKLLVLQVAHELVGNAVIHGMSMRLTGKIRVSLRSSSDGAVCLTVDDDGMGPKEAVPCWSSPILTALVRECSDSIVLSRYTQRTTAKVSLPKIN